MLCTLQLILSLTAQLPPTSASYLKQVLDFVTSQRDALIVVLHAVAAQPTLLHLEAADVVAQLLRVAFPAVAPDLLVSNVAINVALET